MSVIPDKVTPELGWRTWRISRTNGLTLQSTAASAVWLPGEIMRARCDPAFRAVFHPRYYRELVPPSPGVYTPNPPLVVLPHGLCYGLIDEGKSAETGRHGDPPSENCGCGIYALSSLEHLVEQFSIEGSRDEEIFGRVALWGKVIPGDHGWRAQYAYPAEFFLLAPTGNHGGIWRRRRRTQTDELASKLEAWEVPVRVFENRDELLALEEAA